MGTYIEYYINQYYNGTHYGTHLVPTLGTKKRSGCTLGMYCTTRQQARRSPLLTRIEMRLF